MPPRRDVVHAIGGSVVSFCAIYLTGRDGKIAINYTRRESTSRPYKKPPRRVRWVVWVRDGHQARRIVKEATALLEVGGCRRGEYFKAPYDWVDAAVRVAADRQRVKLYHAADLKQLETTRKELRWKKMKRLDN